jgi:uncharacterized membrane protein YhaH (DUF805 family)/Tfp pilus assembly major pilin PilA
MTNPYQTPEGQLTDDDQAYAEVKFFSPGARVNRLRYWAHGMLLSLILYPVMGIGGFLYSASTVAGTIVIGAAYIALVVGSVIIMIQRLHDLNKSGWMSLLFLVPLANIYLIVLLIFFKGTPGRNDYGLQTPPNKTWHWLLALIMPFVFFLGIVAAIALPAYQDYMNRAKAQQSLQQDTQSYEYTDESAYSTDEAYPSEDSGYESPVEEEAPSEYSTDAESAIVDETESDTPQ